MSNEGLFERRGIETVPAGERYGVPRQQVWVWAAANLSMLPVGTGLFVVGLGLSWWQAGLAILIGVLVSYPLVGVIAVGGMRGGAPTMALSRVVFGRYGNKLPVLITYISAIGWEMISIAVGALATRAVLDRLAPGLGSGPALVISFAVMVAATMLFAIYGYHLIRRVQKWITLVVGTITVIYFLLVLPRLSFHLGGPSGSFAVFVGGITLTMVGAALGWVSVGADYSRYLPTSSSRRGVVGWTTLGGGATQAVLMLFGVLLSTSSPALASAVARDPMGALATPLPTWFLLPYLASVILSVIGGAVIDLYSSGIALQALGVRLPRPAAAGIDGVLMTIGAAYVVFFAPTFFAPFQAFLFIIGTFMASWAAVFVADLVMNRKAGYDAPDRKWSWPALSAMVIGTVIGLGLITSADPRFAGLVGYLLPAGAKTSTFGLANMGVVIAFLVAGVLYVGATKVVALRTVRRQEQVVPERS